MSVPNVLSPFSERYIQHLHDCLINAIQAGRADHAYALARVLARIVCNYMNR